MSNQYNRFRKGTEGLGISAPITQEMIDNLPQGTKIHSPTSAADKRVIKHIVDKIPTAIHPEDDRFWPILIKTVELVAMGRRNRWDNNIHIPELDGIIDQSRPSSFISNSMRYKEGVKQPLDLAKAVLSDFPPDYIGELCEMLLANGATVNTDFIPNRNYVDFTDGVVLLARIIGDCIHMVSVNAFYVKWRDQRIRPAEAVHSILTDQMDYPFTVRQEIERIMGSSKSKWVESTKNDLDAFTLTYGATPLHGEFVSMHSAASAACLTLPLFLNLTSSQLEEVRRTVLNIAFGRNILGVHYTDSNLWGIELGERVMVEKLPNYLEQIIATSVNKQYITDRLNTYKVNWTGGL